MKNVSFDIAAVYMACPYCGEALTNSEGSLLWVVVDDIAADTKVLACPVCQKKSKIPTTLVTGKE